MTLNEAIAAFNLPDGVLQISIALTWVWVVALTIIGLIVRIVRAVVTI